MTTKRKGSMIIAALFFSALVFSMPTLLGAQGIEANSKLLEEGEDMELLLNTLNEALEENRQLKSDLEKVQDELKAVVAEGNALRGQLRIYEKRLEKTDKQSDAEMEKLMRETSEKKKELDNLKTEMGTIQKEHGDLKERAAALQEENRKLQTILASSVLEEERDEYIRLIEDAKQATDSALERIASAEKEKEGLREELAAVHFELGNMAYDKRDYEQAVLHYRATLELRPSDSYAHHNLGIIYDYHLKDENKALYHYRNYLSLKPVEEEANEIRERILEVRMMKNIIPELPLKKEYYKHT